MGKCGQRLAFIVFFYRSPRYLETVFLHDFGKHQQVSKPPTLTRGRAQGQSRAPPHPAFLFSAGIPIQVSMLVLKPSFPLRSQPPTHKHPFPQNFLIFCPNILPHLSSSRRITDSCRAAKACLSVLQIEHQKQQGGFKKCMCLSALLGLNLPPSVLHYTQRESCRCPYVQSCCRYHFTRQ